MPKVYDAADQIDAQLVCDWLRAHHLQAEVHGQWLGGGAGELPPGGLCSVWITEAQHLPLARRLIDELEQRRHKAATKRICPHCGETSDSHFELCWRCGGTLRDTDAADV
jgi:hypothetical protein